METIVFLPGLGCTQQAFTHQINSLKHYHSKVIVCNSFSKMDDHVDYILSNSPPKFILVGHSFGGWIAQWVAINAPKRVSKLILMGTATGRLTKELSLIFNDMLIKFEQNQIRDFFDDIWPLTAHENRANDSDLRKIIVDMQNEFTQEQLINQVKTDLEAKDTTAELNKIQCKTLLMLGKQDSFYQDEMRILQKGIPNNEFVEIDNCGHLLTLEKPEIATELMDAWLNASA